MPAVEDFVQQQHRGCGGNLAVVMNSETPAKFAFVCDICKRMWRMPRPVEKPVDWEDVPKIFLKEHAPTAAASSDKSTTAPAKKRGSAR